VARDVAHRLTRLLALAIGLAVLAAAVGFLVHNVRRSFDATAVKISQNKGIPWRQRQVQAAFGLQVSRGFLIAAHAVVPLEARYRLVVGDDLHGQAPPVWSALPALVGYALQPRRTSADARWLLCYGCGFERYPGVVVWEDQGLAILRLPR
jgi:hypothetical protein